MNMILQDLIPPEMGGDVRLPGMAPCGGDEWMRVDEAYAAQMAYRAALLATRREAVLWMRKDALPAAQELLEQALVAMPAHGFEVAAGKVVCPDGRAVMLDFEAPLLTLGALLQEDLCILQQEQGEHVLTGAVLCFPANWRLADKIGRGLAGIHAPVEQYDENLTARVQRLFNGVQVGRPLWRFNRLPYADADLHQPYRKHDAARSGFIRSERQCIVRLPVTRAVVFSIHTYVVRA